MQAVQPIGAMRPQSWRRSKHTITVAVYRKLVLPVVLILAVLMAVFLPTGADETDNIVMSVGSSHQTEQSAAHMLFMSAAAERDANDGTSTKSDLSAAYVDAEPCIATYNPGLVKSNDGLTVGTNTPTRAFDTAYAYVVNVSTLVTAEIQDIITFEQQTLGVQGHEDASVYAKEKLPIENSITAHYGSGSKNLWYGAVGPAITIRDFYQDGKYSGHPTNSAEYFRCFGGSENAYLDAMLVRNEDVDQYLEGQDVPVSYVQFKMFSGNAKAHTAPWGITQTYFQMNDQSSMQPNTSAGEFTPQNYGTTAITGDAPKDLAKLLDLAKSYRAAGRSVYWWPTVLATKSDLGLQFSATDTGITSSTANIFESFSTSQYQTLQRDFAGYSLVGVLVYATQ